MAQNASLLLSRSDWGIAEFSDEMFGGRRMAIATFPGHALVIS
jgi:hypothetical protein